MFLGERGVEYYGVGSLRANNSVRGAKTTGFNTRICFICEKLRYDSVILRQQFGLSYQSLNCPKHNMCNEPMNLGEIFGFSVRGEVKDTQAFDVTADGEFI